MCTSKSRVTISGINTKMDVIIIVITVNFASKKKLDDNKNLVND